MSKIWVLYFDPPYRAGFLTPGKYMTH